MLFQIAWKNIWRNKLRSLVVIVAVALGLFAGAFMMAFSWGINMERARNIIETKLSHVQIHHPDFRTEQKVGLLIEEGVEKLTEIEKMEEVKAATGRLMVNGMLTTTKGGFGVQISGVEPEREAAVTGLHKRITYGNYLDGSRKNQILIGEALAQKLGFDIVDSTANIVDYKLRKKLVLTFQTPNSGTQAAQFRVQGIFKTLNSKYDEAFVFINSKDLKRELGLSSELHEIAIVFHDQEKAEDTTLLGNLNQQYPELAVENWKDLAPDLKLLDESFTQTLIIFIGIIMLALLFGIVNTMLMAILERTRELGMLMSIGMNKFRVFSLIVMETLFLTVIGAPLGLLGAYGLIKYYGVHGIDISAFAEGSASMGVSTTAYTDLEPNSYWLIAVMVFITAIIASIFPAIRALRLKPAEAVRAI